MLGSRRIKRTVYWNLTVTRGMGRNEVPLSGLLEVTRYPQVKPLHEVRLPELGLFFVRFPL